MDEKLLEKGSRLHFVGIGGSGMYPIVQILNSRGMVISGSDNNEGDTIDSERAMGITVHMGHRAENIGDAQAVVYSAAIKSDNVELVAAKERGIPVIERSDMLGYITRQYSDCICVSGTHGKTTTTAMLTQILVSAGLDPTAVIGGKLKLIGGSGRAGKSEIMTCEACEFVDTFLHLSPDIAVILNVDEDHLDYFKNLENIIKSFHRFAGMATKTIIVNGGDANSMKAVEGLAQPVVTFGLSDGCDYSARAIRRLSPTSTAFELVYKGDVLTELVLNIPGRHNILNALAACVSALQVGATPAQLAAGLADFHGAGRRFDVLGNVRGITIADDYAHHPAELAVTLGTAKEMGYNSVWAVFQPFTFSRTAMLLEDFAKALAIADHVVMSEIMGGREHNTFDIHTKDLAEKIPGSVWFQTFEEIAAHVMSNAKDGDLIITLGCGDIYKCAKIMLEK